LFTLIAKMDHQIARRGLRLKDMMNPSILFKATTRDAVAHLLGAGICSAVLFLFVALTYSRIVLPRYTTNYSEKDVQQVVNLIITVVATLIGILFSHCRR
jgi:arginine exporter protein ArgO